MRQRQNSKNTANSKRIKNKNKGAVFQTLTTEKRIQCYEIQPFITFYKFILRQSSLTMRIVRRYRIRYDISFFGIRWTI